MSKRHPQGHNIHHTLDCSGRYLMSTFYPPSPSIYPQIKSPQLQTPIWCQLLRPYLFIKWCPSTPLQHPSTDRHTPPKPEPCFMGAKMDKHRQRHYSHVNTHHDNATPLDSTLIKAADAFATHTQKKDVPRCRRRWGGWAPGAVRARFSSSFSSGVAVTLCGMEDECVCTAAGCDSSRWPFWSAGRQQQCDETALARRTGLSVWQRYGLCVGFVLDTSGAAAGSGV